LRSFGLGHTFLLGIETNTLAALTCITVTHVLLALPANDRLELPLFDQATPVLNSYLAYKSERYGNVMGIGIRQNYF
jgi:hypothetical protein